MNVADRNTARSLKPKTICLNQVGSFFNFPSWRFLISCDPSRAGLEYCRREIKFSCGAARRYFVRLSPAESAAFTENGGKREPHASLFYKASVPFSFSSEMLQILSLLTSQQRSLFYKLYSKQLKAAGSTKMITEVSEKNTVRYWNPRYIPDIKDEALARLLKHVTNITYDEDIDFAIQFRGSDEHTRMFKYIGYSIFAGIGDCALAKRFKLRRGQIKALRELFFDFTNTPTEPIARAAYFTQLADNQQISDEDRRFYRLVCELGELGLRAFASLGSLTKEERYQVEGFLANTMLDNVMALNFAITDMRDAVTYNSIINNLSSYHIKKEEACYYRSKVRNLDATTTRILNSGTDRDADLTLEDEKAFALVSRLALMENPRPSYRTIMELEK